MNQAFPPRVQAALLKLHVVLYCAPV